MFYMYSFTDFILVFCLFCSYYFPFIWKCNMITWHVGRFHVLCKRIHQYFLWCLLVLGKGKRNPSPTLLILNSFDQRISTIFYWAYTITSSWKRFNRNWKPGLWSNLDVLQSRLLWRSWYSWQPEVAFKRQILMGMLLQQCTLIEKKKINFQYQHPMKCS